MPSMTSSENSLQLTITHNLNDGAALCALPDVESAIGSDLVVLSPLRWLNFGEYEQP